MAELMKGYTPLWVILIVSNVTLQSCIDPFPSSQKEPIPYLELTSEHFEWLDINGYWIYQDIYDNIDTAYVYSEVNKHVCGGGTTYVPYFCFDKIELTVGYCPIIGSDSSIVLMLNSTYDRNYHPQPPIYLCIEDNVFNGCMPELVESLYENPNPSLTDSSVFLFQSDVYNLTYVFKKGIGISSYKYEDGDSTFSATLIDYQLE